MKPTEPLSPAPPDVLTGLTRFEPSELRDAELELCLLDGLDLFERDVSETRISDSRLSNVDLSGSSLKGATLRDVIVEEGSWANVGAERVSLHRVRLERLRSRPGVRPRSFYVSICAQSRCS